MIHWLPEFKNPYFFTTWFMSLLFTHYTHIMGEKSRMTKELLLMTQMKQFDGRNKVQKNQPFVKKKT